MKQIRVKMMSPTMVKLLNFLLIISATLITVFVFSDRFWWVVGMTVVFIADCILLDKSGELEIWEDTDE